MSGLALAAVLGLGASSAEAQRRTTARAVGEYTGVTPGSGHNPPRGYALSRARERGNRVLTWPGFQPRPDGASRFFVQMTAPVQPQVLREENRIVVVLPNTSVHLTNTRRSLETRFFNTPVNRARVERRGRNLAIVLELRSRVSPQVSSQTAQNGYHFVFIEFPPGEHLPEELRPPEPVTESPADTSLEAIENERPPALR
ncbi:MAG: AMIN domain-containing protein [Myxococcota bacterium]